MEALNAVGGVLLAFSIANCWNPLGWGGVAVSLVYSAVTFKALLKKIEGMDLFNFQFWR